MIWAALLLFLSSLHNADSYKYLIYSPLFGHSHTKFLGTLADLLTEAGHDVTVLMPRMNKMLTKTEVKSTKDVMVLEGDPRVYELFGDDSPFYKDIWTHEPDPALMLKFATNMSLSVEYNCEKLMKNNELLEDLRSRNFDVGLSEPFQLCGFALFELLGLKKTIGAISSSQLDGPSMFIGQPLAPSYVPGTIMDQGATAKMSLKGRMWNLFGTYMGMMFFNSMYDSEEKFLKTKYGFTKGKEDLISQVSIMFSNGNPYLNFPMPVIHKTVEIGGITVDGHERAVEPLNEKWNKVLSERPYTVLISFGSVAKSKDMPDNYKKSILQLCKELENEVTFIWKYEEETTMGDGIKNLYLSPWLPQPSLLADPRLSLFVTHGGLGSTIEVAYLGKPTLMIPLFADQPRNVAMLSQHGSAISLAKTNIANPEILKKTILDAVKNKELAHNAQLLSDILKNRPIANKDLFIKHCEFVAKYGPLTQLDPYGRHLSFIQYYFLDVFALILSVIIFVIVSVFCVCKTIYRRTCGSRKTKIE